MIVIIIAKPFLGFVDHDILLKRGLTYVSLLYFTIVCIVLLCYMYIILHTVYIYIYVMFMLRHFA